jgi:hypothetical protein
LALADRVVCEIKTTATESTEQHGIFSNLSDFRSFRGHLQESDFQGGNPGYCRFLQAIKNPAVPGFLN